MTRNHVIMCISEGQTHPIDVLMYVLYECAAFISLSCLMGCGVMDVKTAFQVLTPLKSTLKEKHSLQE